MTFVLASQFHVYLPYRGLMPVQQCLKCESASRGLLPFANLRLKLYTAGGRARRGPAVAAGRAGDQLALLLGLTSRYMAEWERMSKM